MTVYRKVPLSDLPERHYRTAYIDPPWKYLTWSKKGLSKSPDNHYDTMTVDELKALPVLERLTPDAVAHVWVIDTHLEIALDVIRAWGLKYKTVGFYWAKTTKDGKGFPIGTGFWTRANPEHTYECEIECRDCGGTGWFYGEPGLPCHCQDQEAERCLLTTTKKPPARQSRGVPRLIVSPRREHSRKPDEAYERIEALTEGPYLEMFSRNERAGWDCWGEEAGNFAYEKAKRAPRASLAEKDGMEFI